ncbi:MAG: TIGR03790 family protein [Proteobacteria bacterium]|nr:TIGR03790 family protein [Pseudomonadota bacterium]
MRVFRGFYSLIICGIYLGISACGIIPSNSTISSNEFFIVTQPTSTAISLGESAYFKVEVNGSDKLKFQWFKYGSLIQGATNPTFILNSTTSNDAANYHVEIDLGSEKIKSHVAKLQFFSNENEYKKLYSKDSANKNITFEVPIKGLTSNQIGLLVNTQDPQSVEVANYYQLKRNIPESNILRIALSSSLGDPDISSGDLINLQTQISNQMPSSVQALVISWTTPWRVPGENSITSAIGLNLAYDSIGCGIRSAINYPVNAKNPFQNYNIRPTMMLAGQSVEEVKALIDRGISADDSFPTGDIYTIRTSDSTRSNPRFSDFLTSSNLWNFTNGLRSYFIDNSTSNSSNYLQNVEDILLYQTGLTTVPQISSNHYLPGAIADTLTSYSGIITGPNSQMSALRWLEAGLTASYGTVTEPCAYSQKFPKTSLFLESYFSGDTLVEAYWKSVKVPMQGLFIGEPLAKPFGSKITLEDLTPKIKTTALKTSTLYGIFESLKPQGPWSQIGNNIVLTKQQMMTIELANSKSSYFRVAELLDLEAPEITSVSLEENEEISDYFGPISVIASDNSLKISKVEFYIDSDLWDYNESGVLNTYIYCPDINDGAHTLTIKVYDPSNNIATHSVNFVVKN